MRQLGVVWDGTIPIRAFLKDKKQTLELLNLSVSETLISIKNCFPDEEPFRTCFSNFEIKYINTNYRSLSKLCKEIIQVVEDPPAERDLQFPTVADNIANADEVICHKDTTEAVEDATEVVEDTTEAVEDATEVVEDTTEVVEDTTEVVEDTTEVVEDITEDVQDTTEVVQDADDVIWLEAAEVVKDYETIEQLLNTLCLSIAAEQNN
jgi:transcriptional regulator with PAS, ATPase and Fis domain